MLPTIFWLIAIVFMAIGLIGTVLPILPGTTIILAAALLHRIALGPEHSIGIAALAALVALTLLSYLLDAAAGFIGATRFGASRWGLAGAALGGVIGLFFGLPGLFAGPVVGAVIGEVLGGKKIVEAGRAGWGTVLGGLLGMIAKVVIGLAMVAIFLTNVPSPL